MASFEDGATSGTCLCSVRLGTTSATGGHHRLGVMRFMRHALELFLETETATPR
jgi:hypothetical protein